MSQTYKIIRHSLTEPPRITKTGLSLVKAQAHCNDPSTAGEGWFDGFAPDGPTKHSKSVLVDALRYNFHEKRGY